MALTPTTELEAINLMLSVIGESPVNSVTSSGVADANLAYQILQFASREVQLVGWHWNTERRYPLVPDANKYLVLPSNCLRVDTTGYDADVDIIQRGSKMYDPWNHTYEFIRAVTVDMVVLLEFDELPEAARSYITIRAARQFQERVVGSEVLQAFNARDEYQAMAYLREAEADTSDHNILGGNWSVARVLARGGEVTFDIVGGNPAVPAVLDPDVVEIN